MDRQELSTHLDNGKFYLPDLVLVAKAPHSRQDVMGTLESTMIK